MSEAIVASLTASAASIPSSCTMSPGSSLCLPYTSIVALPEQSMDLTWKMLAHARLTVPPLRSSASLPV